MCEAGANCTSSSQQSVSLPWQGRNTADLALLKCADLVEEGRRQGVPPGLNVSCCQVGILSCFHDNSFLSWGMRSCTCDLDEKDNGRMYII